MYFYAVGYWRILSFETLLKVVTYAEILVNISDEENNTIHSIKSLLFNNTDVWIKKNRDSDFDIIMGSFHRAELC